MNHCGNTLVLCALALIAVAGPVCATSYNDNASGNWTTPSTWSPAGVPGVGDGVAINSGTVTIDSTVGIDTIVMGGSGVVVMNSNAVLSIYGYLRSDMVAGPFTMNSGSEMRLVRDGVRVYGSNNPDLSFNVNAGSQITVDLPLASDSCEIGGGGNKLKWYMWGGLIDIRKGRLRLSASAGNDAEFSAGSIAVSTNGIFELATDTDIGTSERIVISGEGTTEITSGIRVGSAGLTIDTKGHNRWTAGGIRLDGPLTLAAGRTLEFSGADRGIARGSSRFNIYGTFTHNGSKITLDRSPDLYVKNGGVYKFVADGSILTAQGSESDDIFIQSGGSIGADLTATGGKATLDHTGNGFLRIYAGASVFATNGELVVTNSVGELSGSSTSLDISVAIHNGTLTAGERTVGWGTVSSNCTLKLGGTNAVFRGRTGGSLLGSLDTVDGALAVVDGQRYTNDTVNFTATAGLGFGLNAPDTPDSATTTNAFLTVNGTCTIADGITVTVENSGGLFNGTYLLVSATTLNVDVGTLELDVSRAAEGGWPGSARLRQVGNTLLLDMIAAGTLITVY